MVNDLFPVETTSVGGYFGLLGPYCWRLDLLLGWGGKFRGWKWSWEEFRWWVTLMRLSNFLLKFFGLFNWVGLGVKSILDHSYHVFYWFRVGWEETQLKGWGLKAMKSELTQVFHWFEYRSKKWKVFSFVCLFQEVSKYNI